jgi:hypothetical protein
MRRSAACVFGKLAKNTKSSYIRCMRAIFYRYRSSARRIPVPRALLARAAICPLAIHRHDQGTLACLRSPR